MSEPLVEIRGLTKRFSFRRGWFARPIMVEAVRDASLKIERAETLAIVGESGSGKSTLGRCLLRLIPLSEGEILLEGQRIDTMDATSFRALRRNIQAVFQDPFASLNPRMNVGDIIAEPLRNFGLASPADMAAQVARRLDQVRLPAKSARKKPHEFSGGQRQRIAIARALAAEPKLIVCDEAMSALDVSIKAQILDLLRQLQADFGLSMIFISHDLPMVRHLAHRVAVMQAGRIVEQNTTQQIFEAPQELYTKSLLAAALTIDRPRQAPAAAPN